MAPSHDLDDDEDHGGLVKKILETKKELEGGSQTSQARQPKRTEIVSAIILFHRQYADFIGYAPGYYLWYTPQGVKFLFFPIFLSILLFFLFFSNFVLFFLFFSHFTCNLYFIYFFSGVSFQLFVFLKWGTPIIL